MKGQANNRRRIIAAGGGFFLGLAAWVAGYVAVAALRRATLDTQVFLGGALVGVATAVAVWRRWKAAGVHSTRASERGGNSGKPSGSST